MEENNKDNDFVLAETEQDFTIVTNNDTNFEINATDSENIASILAKNAVAKLVGSFKPTTAGKKTLTAAFIYGEGSVEPVQTETEVIAVKLEISLVSPNPFPTSLPKNFTQEVEFVIKYNELDTKGLSEDEITGLAATGIIIEGLDELGAVTINKEALENQTEGTRLDIGDFKKGDPKDSTVQLDPRYQFRIKGKLKTDQMGSNTLKILVKYHELAYLPAEDAAKEGAKFEQAFEIQAIEIVGEATKLPVKIKLGSTHQVIFQFTNTNTEFSATGVNITIEEENVSRSH